jgi:hypothetical protein
LGLPTSTASSKIPILEDWAGSVSMIQQQINVEKMDNDRFMTNVFVC